MIEDVLGEGLSTRVGTELTVEAEGLSDREVSLDSEHGGSGPLFFAKHLSTTLVQDRVDTTNSILRTLDLNYKAWLEDVELGEEGVTHRDRSVLADQE